MKIPFLAKFYPDIFRLQCLRKILETAEEKKTKLGVQTVKILELPVLSNAASPLCSPNLILFMESCDIIFKNVFVCIRKFGKGKCVILPH